MRRTFLGWALGLMGLVGCMAKDEEQAPAGLGDVASNWELEDLNESSASFGALRGPAGERGRVSAWYFGHST